MTRIVAQQDIYIDNPDVPWDGARVLLYRAGEYVRQEDAQLLGLLDEPVPVVDERPKDKARRGPREPAKGAASRDRALSAKEV